MTQVAVWNRDQDVKRQVFGTSERSLEYAVRLVIEDAAVKRRPVMFFCDGPPSAVYRKTRTVCFTDPNPSWMGEASRSSAYVTLYLPPWEREELYEATRALPLAKVKEPLVPATIDDRFYHFGGVTRYCLARDDDALCDRLDRIKDEIDGMYDLGHVKELVWLEDHEHHEIHHALCHFFVMSPTFSRGYTVQAASKFVTRLLHEKVDKSGFDRKELTRWLQDIGKFPQYAYFLFDIRAHEKLVTGGHLEVRVLGSAAREDPLALIVRRSRGFYFYEADTQLAELHDKGLYHIASAASAASIDAFYFPTAAPKNGHRVLLFVMTCSKTHPVHANGILDVLSTLQLVEVVLEKPDSIALVFIVPENQAGAFPQQAIVTSESSDDASVLNVKGIHPTAAKELQQHKISTIGQLKQALSERRFAQLKGYVAEHEKHADLMVQLSSVLISIPQYVCGI